MEHVKSSKGKSSTVEQGARAIPFRLYVYIYIYIYHGSLFRSSMNVRQEEKVECAAEQNNYSGFSTSRLDY